MKATSSGKGIGLAEMAEALSARLPRITAPERIIMPTALFGSKVIITTSFGPTSAVILHMASKLSPGIIALNVRHGYETAGTLEFIEECQKRFRIKLVTVVAPRVPVPRPGGADFDEFQQTTKVQPLREALAGLGAWFWLSGVMHDETETRREMKMARARHGAIAIYPILDWTSEQALDYCIKNDLPINNDYFDPCKGPDQSLECGLHYDAKIPCD